jgi:transcriptional regulator with XRE-family HTH domain
MVVNSTERDPKVSKGLVGERLKAWRGERTQFDLAVSIGTTPQTISLWENGNMPDAVLMLAALANEGADLNWLLAGRPKGAT